MCIEFVPDQIIISEGEKAGEIWRVVEMAGAIARDVNTDDSHFRTVNFNHNGLVREVGVVWEQMVEVVFLGWE